MNRLTQLAINDEGFIFDPLTGESFSVNQTGLFIIKLLKEGKQIEQIVQELISEFETDEDTAKRDVIDFIEKLRSYKLA